MKKIKAFVLFLVLALSLVGCGTKSTGNSFSVVDGAAMPNNSTAGDTEKIQGATIKNHPSGFDGEKLYINVSGETLVFERYEPGVGSLTKNAILDTFDTETEIEGIAWAVYSVEEYPDLSYVLVLSGTNASWTYRIINLE